MKLVSEKIVSELVGRAVQTLRNDRFRGLGFPYVRVGKSIRYDLEEIEKIIQSQRVSTKLFCEADEGGE